MSFPFKFPVDATEPILTLTNRMSEYSFHPVRLLMVSITTRIAKRSLWLIELHNGEDNRLTTVMIDGAIKPALDAVEQHWREQWRPAQKVKGKEDAKGALIIVGKQSQDKFFSNGELIFASQPS
jgi:hypothetical protein